MGVMADTDPKYRAMLRRLSRRSFTALKYQRVVLNRTHVTEAGWRIRAGESVEVVGRTQGTAAGQPTTLTVYREVDGVPRFMEGILPQYLGPIETVHFEGVA